MKIRNSFLLRDSFVYRLLFISFLVVSSGILAFSGAALCADIKVAWDANSESDLAGYIVFYGTASGNYPNTIDVGNNTQHTLKNLTEGTTYYFAVKAYDTDNNQSDFSTELAYSIPISNSAPDTPAKPAGPTNGFLNTSYGYDTSGTDPDGDLLTYRFDWGDGITSGWGGAHSRTHSYAAAGTYCIKAQSQDTHGAISGWSPCLNVSVDIQNHTISASAGSNGSMSPYGSVKVNNGADQTFTISPNTNYRVKEVFVDGSSVGSVTTYTFNNVDSDHTITASFAFDNQAPVSDAGADRTVRVSDTVQLDGSASGDANGDSLSYIWSIVSKPNGSSAALSSTTAVKPTLRIDVAGSYTVNLIVNDGTVDSAPDTVNIIAQNTAPLSDAGVDQTVRVNDTVQLDGSASGDANGDSLSYKWSFVSKPNGSAAGLSNANILRPTFVVDVAGTYTLRLVVNDGTVDSSPDTVTVSTENSPAVSNAGADQTVQVNDTVQLDGSGSSDIDGDSLTFKWAFISRPLGSNSALSSTKIVKPFFDVDVAGTYILRLIVNDGSVDSAPDTVTISTENSAPVANAGADQSARLNDRVQLDGSSSSDADGDSLTYNWSIVSKPNGSIATLSNSKAVKPTFDVDVAGTYTVQLIINDGTVDSPPVTVTISTENSAPVAEAGVDQTARVKDAVQLDGSGSSDVDGDSLTYKWSLINRPGGSNASLFNATALKPVFDVDIAGTYTVQLIVNDGTVDSAPDTVTISTENSAPVANAGADQAVQVNDVVQLDGSSSSDVDGDSLTFQWSLVTRPGGSAAILSNVKAVKPSFTVDVAGTYTVQLTVNDGTEISSPDLVTISTDNSAPVANAGADQAVLVNDTVQLDGRGSSDVDGDILTYEWSVVSRPVGSNAVLSNTKVDRPTFVVDSAGSYTLQLIVNDGTVNSAPDTVTISTDNSVPVSDAGADQLVRLNDTVQLDGDGSSDADGDTLTFKWSVSTKPGGSNAKLSSITVRNPKFVADAAGTYTMQLIVYDGTDYSAPDTVTITTENEAPVSNAGHDQIVDEGVRVTLSGSNSTDPDENIATYYWKQTGGIPVALSSSDEAETTFIAPGVTSESEILIFQLTVHDAKGLHDVDTCQITVNRVADVDTDGDGVPDNQDAFPNDPTEILDTDGDGEGNNSDTDDDDDGIPDSWELSNGLDPLKDDAFEDFDGDGINNLDEYLAFENSINNDTNVSPDAPFLISPADDDLVGLTPKLTVDEFYDPDIDNIHAQTQWQIFLLHNKNSKCVYELRSQGALTSLRVPSLILDAKTDYSWRVRFYDNHAQPSEWSEYGYFSTHANNSDLDENGIPDDQEANPNIDLDGNGIPDADEINIKTLRVKNKKEKLIGISILDAPRAVSIATIQSADPGDQQLYPEITAPPGQTPFGLVDFKVTVETPGDEAELIILFSEEVPPESVWYKYDSVQNTWIDFSDYAVLSPSRMSLTLYLQDGGPGDADGIANGIIVDPSGIVNPSALYSYASEETGSENTKSSDGSSSSSCFIVSLQEDSDNGIEQRNYWIIAGFHIFLFTGFALLGILQRIKSNKN